MEHHDISSSFEQGEVLLPGVEFRAIERPWYSHPAWDGVFLKDLVTGKETGGAFSYHLVRVAPYREAAAHVHDTEWEWNVVLAGTGSMLVDGRDLPVGRPGQTFVTPPRIRHTVRAGAVELSLLALFVPALA